ncbi:PncC family amidohydrolase [Pseudobacter ginsenosidimutans]|uniref:PncC family amidohydrolase n=2 Tax=Pseudobacter ginsenosidimutans TaxID=661488 RepID=A0A4Q7MRD1_9BACT|nr:CinA family protein [Pseudobacter ginsenosidimutans]RZS71147.1 PncC family amidohydrolase [Pseudobacter ginsenosidimutans]
MPAFTNICTMLPFDQKLLSEIGKELLKNEQTIAVAESVTTGMIQQAMGSIKDAMQFYQGGITTYNIPQKFRHLGVEPIAAEKCNAVSGAVASQMALGVSALFGSHWGIGITGYASPVPESGNRLFAYFAIAFRKKVLAEKILHHRKKTDSVADVQLTYVNAVLAALHKVLSS